MDKQKFLYCYHLMRSGHLLTLSLTLAILLLTACGKKGDPKSVDCHSNQTDNYLYPPLDETS